MALIKIITLTLLFTFFIIIKCDAQNKENNATTLQGNFNKYDFLDFYYLDSIDNVESKMINYFKKTYFKKEISNSNFLHIAFNGVSSLAVYYFLFPADTINITINSTEDFTLTSLNIIRNKELKIQRDIIAVYGGNYPYEVDVKNSYADNLLSIKKLSNDRYKFIEKEYSKKNISSRFSSLYNLCLKYNRIQDELYPVYSKLPITKEIEINLLQYIDEFNKPELIGMNEYRFAAWGFLNFLTQRKTKNLTPELMIEECKLSFKGLTKDYLLAKIYKEFKERNKKYCDSIFATVEIADTFYKKYVTDNIVKHSGKGMFENDILVKTDKSFTSLNNIIKANKNSYIFMDFWASWCIPCRAEMKYYQTIFNRYKGKKIKFLFFSLDKDIAVWKKAQAEYQFLSANNSYLFEENFDSHFVNVNQIKSIPRYMLLGKDGNILAKDAPRPSDAKLKILIEKYIKQ